MAKIEKTEAEWREELGELEYKVTRCAATEHAFTGKYYEHFEDGIYTCICCKTPLFDSSHKFESHCGWPSFSDVLAPSHVEEREDRTHGMRRVEVLCDQCEAHLGHVFPDGPPPKGLRYCINSASIDFVAREDVGAKA